MCNNVLHSLCNICHAAAFCNSSHLTIFVTRMKEISNARRHVLNPGQWIITDDMWLIYFFFSFVRSGLWFLKKKWHRDANINSGGGWHRKYFKRQKAHNLIVLGPPSMIHPQATGRSCPNATTSSKCVSSSSWSASPSLHRGNTPTHYHLLSNSKNTHTFTQNTLQIPRLLANNDRKWCHDDRNKKNKTKTNQNKQKKGSVEVDGGAVQLSSPLASAPPPPMWVTGQKAVRKLLLSSQRLLGMQRRRLRAVAVTLAITHTGWKAGPPTYTLKHSAHTRTSQHVSFSAVISHSTSACYHCSSCFLSVSRLCANVGGLCW